MNLFSRLIRHLCFRQRSARRAFPQPTLDVLQAAIGDGERLHRAQVKLIIEPSLSVPQVLHRTSSRARAHVLFAHHRIWDTEENCGVLVYVNLADQKVEIIPDRSIARLVPRNDWEAVCRSMTERFAQGQFHDGALAGLVHANTLLEQHFPRLDGAGRDNELSDHPVML